MRLPDPQISVQRFPLDSELAFYRLRVRDEARPDALSLLVERLRDGLAEATSEIKVNLAQDGGAFIMAFLPDKQPLNEDAVRALALKAARGHVEDFRSKERS